MIHALNLYILRLKAFKAGLPDDEPAMKSDLDIEINEAQVQIDEIESRMEKSFEKQFEKEVIYDL